MTNPWFQLGAAFAGLVLFAVVSFEGRGVAESLGLVEPDEPVLVFEIPHPERLAGVRRAIRDERVLFDADAGFAARGGRLYVRDVGEAGALITAAGWGDQPIRIVSLGMDDDEKGGDGRGASKLSDEERMARLRALVHKPTLTRGEQMFVLQAMNDGLEI